MGPDRRVTRTGQAAALRHRQPGGNGVDYAARIEPHPAARLIDRLEPGREGRNLSAPRCAVRSGCRPPPPPWAAFALIKAAGGIHTSGRRPWRGRGVRGRPVRMRLQFGAAQGRAPRIASAIMRRHAAPHRRTGRSPVGTTRLTDPRAARPGGPVSAPDCPNTRPRRTGVRVYGPVYLEPSTTAVIRSRSSGRPFLGRGGFPRCSSTRRSPPDRPRTRPCPSDPATAVSSRR